MYYYAYSLRQARFVVVNCSWTKVHVDSILRRSNKLLDIIYLLPPLVLKLLEVLSRRCMTHARWPRCRSRAANAASSVSPGSGRCRFHSSICTRISYNAHDAYIGRRKIILHKSVRSTHCSRSTQNTKVLAPVPFSSSSWVAAGMSAMRRV